MIVESILIKKTFLPRNFFIIIFFVIMSHAEHNLRASPYNFIHNLSVLNAFNDLIVWSIMELTEPKSIIVPAILSL